MREIIYLSCGECKRRNYVNRRNKKLHTDKLTISKYCRFCAKHTEHKETK